MGFSLGSFFDPAGITTGDAGENLTNFFDPAGGLLENAGVDMGALGDWRNQQDSYFGDLADFENFQLQEWERKFRNNPEQLFIGAGDPFSTKMWNEATGSSYEPFVNQWGGPAKETYQKAENAGVDTSNAGGAHQVAQTVAAFKAGGALAGSYSGAASAAGASPSVAGAIGGATSGAMIGAGNALSNGGDVWKGVGQGALGGAISGGIDYGGAVGIEDQMYKKLFNSTVGGGVKAGVRGDNVGEGALKGFTGAAIPMAAQQGGTMLNGMFQDDDLYAQQGSLGGGARDQYGESTVDYGGEGTPYQSNVNITDGLGYENSNAPVGVQPVPLKKQGGAFQEFLNAATGAKTPTSAGQGYGNIASNLLGLYQANRQRKDFQGQQNSLNNLFSANSPYAQQMRQTLDRRDAAGGRRSQYGPREAQLMAALTQQQAGLAPQQFALQQQIGRNQNQMWNNGLQGLGNLYNQYPQMQQDWGSLMNMFGGQ